MTITTATYTADLDTITREIDLCGAFAAGRDDGYAVGDEHDDIEALGGLLGELLGTVGTGDEAIAVYRSTAGLVLVGDVHGPWAVRVEVTR